MAWPFSKPQTKPGPKRMTAEERKKKEDFKREREERRLVHEEYVQKLKTDPELMRQALAETYKLNIKAIDPAEQKKRQFQDKVAERLLGMLESDEKFAAEVIEAEKNKLIEEYASGSAHDFGGDHYPDDPIAQYIETTERLKQIKEMGGGGGGGILGTILNSEMAKEMGPFLVALFSGRLSELQAQAPVQQMGPAQQLAQPSLSPPAVTPPETVTEPIKMPPKKPPEAPPETPTELSLDISAWADYLDAEPEVFVAELKRLAEIEGDGQAYLVLEVLRTNEAYEILEMLQPLKDRDDVRELIARLEGQEWWLAAVVGLVRGEGVTTESGFGEE